MITNIDEFMETVPPNHWNERETWKEELKSQLESFPTLLTLLMLDILASGQHLPVIVDDDGVVDGHSRVLAIKLLGGFGPGVVEWERRP